VGLISGRIRLDPDKAILPPGVSLIAGALVGETLSSTTPTTATLALPMGRVIEIAGDLQEFGYVERGYLGVQVELTEVVHGHGRRMRGVLIHETVDLGPAHQAGLIPGDVILEYAGARVETPEDLSFLVSATAPGSAVPVRYLRRGRRVTAHVSIEQAPDLGWTPELDQALGIAVDPAFAPRAR
jgi:S1-C subfamily serine protease